MEKQLYKFDQKSVCVIPYFYHIQITFTSTEQKKYI